ncbi:hypothetical protein [Enterococcus faecalis]|uniref:hypothetical protein n=1 Tax=Enterococcus faecalis TaxID=1351 RepID=UPI00288F58CF|nr:hypothetical protein [Enterococcus faecalis]MDT2227872.1 hypothetical protein [Enterococcus faecalis]
MQIKEKKQKASKGSLLDVFKSKDMSILDTLPFKSCDESGVIRTKNDTYQRYLQIKTNDLDSLNDNELAEMLDSLTNACRTYVDDVKIIALTNKTDTSVMQAYWRKQMNNAQEQLLKNPLDVEAASNKQVSIENIQRLQRIELERPDLNFYYVIYADSVKELERKERLLKNKASAYRLKSLNKAETTTVVYRCNNMNDE